MTINNNKIFTKRSVTTGAVTVFGVLALGVGIALTGGFVTPHQTKADYNPTISDIFQMTGVSAGAASSASSAASASAGDAAAAAAASSASAAAVSVGSMWTGPAQVPVVGVAAGSASGSGAAATTGGSGSSASGAAASAAAAASASVTVSSQPTCTLTTNASASAISWSTSGATAATINGTPVSSLSNGSMAVSAAQAGAYTLVAVNATGSVTCTTIVTPPSPNAPTCTLTASPTTLTQGNAGSLIWTTTNASSVSITSIGNVEMNGSRTISPSASMAYTLTATGNGGTVHCVTTVTVVHTQNTPSCTLSVSQNTINEGQSVTLYWSGSNVTSMTIDQGVGQVNPTSGSQVVYPGSSRTYTATAYGPGGTVTCAASVSVNPYYYSNGPTCNMTLSQYTIREGEQVSLRWDSSNTNSVSINNGIGNVGQNGVRIVAPRAGTYTYQGVFYGTNGQSITCLATLRVDPEFISYGQPNVSLTQLPTPPEQPLTSLYLSDLPYTGLDLGPVGTMLYWLALIIWSIALAYLIFWSLAPLAYKKVAGGKGTGHGTGYTYPVSSPMAQIMETTRVVETPVSADMYTAPKPSESSSFEGFKATASGDSLSIEDIVKGLARHSAPEYDVVAPVAEVKMTETTVAPTPVIAPVAQTQRAVTTEVDHNVPAFITALLAAEKDQVFGMIRELNRAGQDVEQFLTHVVVALDDAYRAKIDGTPVHPEVARVCVDCAPSFLERVISSLTTVVDGSYVTGVTGVKLAVTRALHAVEG